MDDAVIVELYLSRNESAISLTAQKYGARLRTIANSIVDDLPSAEECENDTYLAAWNLIPPNEPRTYLFSFLGKITRHLAIDICRKNGSRKRQALFCELTEEMEACIPSRSDVEESFNGRELEAAINSFLETCPLVQQNMFVRRYWFFDSVPEISRRYGCSQSKVKTTLFRMRTQLRDFLKKGGYML